VSAVVKSISYDQPEIIKAILHLHVPAGRIDCDPTYSKGNFYKNTGIESPRYKFDIEPIEGVEFGDSRNLPLINNSIKALGNGWTAEVIIHLLSHALKGIEKDGDGINVMIYGLFLNGDGDVVSNYSPV
jgi:hypothetical protein